MNNIITISDFNEIVKGMKAMKADLLYVKGNTLYGTDNNFTILKTYVMDITVPIQPFTIITKTLSSEFYNSIIDVYINIDTDINKIYCTSNKAAVMDYDEMINNKYNNRIESIIGNLTRDIYNPLCRSEEFGDITDDDNFQRFKTIRSADGAELYSPYGNIEYSMFLYTGCIPMTKADRIIFNAYNLGNTFIGQFTILKKKMNPVNLYIRFVKIDRYRA